MKIAIIHDWLVSYAGAEKVLEQILFCYPQADLYCLVDFLPQEQRLFLKDKKIFTSFIQSLPFAKKKYRNYLPFMPLAIEQFDLSSYNLIISSSHAVAKGVITGPDQLHVSYIHSPIRYAWDLQHQYLKEAGLEKGVKSLLAKWILHKMRIWDSRTANGVDHFIANSQYISRRIHKVYRRESTVIYPPVDIEKFQMNEQKDDFYLTASRMVPYKKMDLIVESFSQMPDKKLIVIGEGPEFKKIKRKADANIELLGYQPDEVLKKYLERAKAFIFAAEEDFGILPVEAQACGTPVIAFEKGGSLETIKGIFYSKRIEISDDQGLSGVFFDEQKVGSLINATNFFDSHQEMFLSKECRKNSEKFSILKFRTEFKEFVERKWRDFELNKRLF